MPAYSSMLRGLGIDIEESEVTRIIQELKAEFDAYKTTHP